MLKYIGDGSALVIDQVPARDLTDEEVTQFGEEKLINSGLYAKPENKQQAGEQWQQTASRN